MSSEQKAYFLSAFELLRKWLVLKLWSFGEHAWYLDVTISSIRITNYHIIQGSRVPPSPNSSCIDVCDVERLKAIRRSA